MSYPQVDAEGELTARVVKGQLERAAASRELAELGIENASPADIEWWLTYTPQQRRRASLTWVVLNASYA